MHFKRFIVNVYLFVFKLCVGYITFCKNYSYCKFLKLETEFVCVSQ